MQPTAGKVIQLTSEITFDGRRDFIFCSSDVNEEKKYVEEMQDENSIIVACITDPSITTKKLEFRITYKNESVYLIHSPFDYEYSNGVFMNLKPQEEYPLHIGSVI